MCKGCHDNEQLRLNRGLELANAFGVIPTNSKGRNTPQIFRPFRPKQRILNKPGATRFALAPGFHISRLWRWITDELVILLWILNSDG